MKCHSIFKKPNFFIILICFVGLRVTSAFNNDKAAKVFNHILAVQMRQEVIHRVSEANFFSWLIDGSTAAKHKLTYESELVFVRTAADLKPKMELLNYVPMKPYCAVNSDNLMHAVTNQMLLLDDGEYENDDHTCESYESWLKTVLSTCMCSHKHKGSCLQNL